LYNKLQPVIPAAFLTSSSLIFAKNVTLNSIYKFQQIKVPWTDVGARRWEPLMYAGDTEMNYRMPPE